ncbi:MAG: peptidase [Thermoanaerobaculia bacterium]|nr:peptidase [Thermoanaerobaculia bacterium]
MKIKRALLPAIVVCTLAAPGAFAGAKITINNNDGASEGFNDPTVVAPVGGNTGTTVGQQRLIAFQKAADIWAQTLDSDAEIVIDARFDPLECDAESAVLGSAGPRWISSDFAGAPAANTWYHGALVNRLSGEDGDTTRAEISARFNSDLGKPGCLTGSGWYYGLDHNNGEQQDLVVVLLHEFGHGLGFSEFVDSDTGEFIEGQVDAYASFLFDNKTNKRWSAMTNGERLASAVNTGAVVLDGPNVVADAPQFLEGNGAPRVVVTSPPAIAATYAAAKAAFGGSLGVGGPRSGTFILATDGTDSTSASTTDACGPLTNAASVAGKIALADRGNCLFVIKAANVQSAGGIGLIVVNNEDNSNLPPLGGSDGSITIPVVGITKADGATIRAQLGGGVTGRMELGPSTGLAGTDSSGRPFVFAPSTFNPGSSTSHYDTSASPNVLMEPFINDDLDNDLDLTESYFRDAGWFAASTMKLTMKDSLLADADADGKADPGDTIRYSLNVANTAGAGATSVVLTNTPDANTTLVTGSVQTSSGTVTSGNGAGNSSVRIALTGLKPGATATAQFDVVVKSGISSAATAIVNQASLAGSNFSTVPSDDPDTATSNDSTSTPLDLNPVKVDKSVVVTADADSSGGVTSGDTLTYTITVRNDGTTPLSDVVLADTPDPNTTIVAGSVTTSQGTITSGNAQGATSVNVSLGGIAPAGVATVVLSVKLDADIPTRTMLIVNQATVTGANFPAVLSNDPRNTAPSDPTSIGIQQPRKRTARR